MPPGSTDQLWLLMYYAVFYGILVGEIFMLYLNVRLVRPQVLNTALIHEHSSWVLSCQNRFRLIPYIYVWQELDLCKLMYLVGIVSSPQRWDNKHACGAHFYRITVSPYSPNLCTQLKESSFSPYPRANLLIAMSNFFTFFHKIETSILLHGSPKWSRW